MFPATMSNSTTLSDEASVSSGARVLDFCSFNYNNTDTGDKNNLENSLQQPQQLITTIHNNSQQHLQQKKMRKKRNLPGNPDPDAEVIALSPKTLLATNRFVCEICNKGFQRDQNLQLHRRGHNLPWKLKQRGGKDQVVRKRAYVCPEPTCVHHHPSRALGDLTGIKKHYCRKHGEKKWKCEKCSKIYAVQSDWKAHSKTCGTREYRCDCGTLFSRKDSFVTHRAFCDALAEESARLSASQLTTVDPNIPLHHHHLQPPPTLFPLPSLLCNPPPPQLATHASLTPNWDPPQNPSYPPLHAHVKPEILRFQVPPLSAQPQLVPPFQALHGAATGASAHLSATALLQKATTMGAAATSAIGHHHHHHHSARTATHIASPGTGANYGAQSIPPELFKGLAASPLESLGPWRKSDGLTRDFLGLAGEVNAGSGRVSVGSLLGFTKGMELQEAYEREQSALKVRDGFGFADQNNASCFSDLE
ncbi:protein indeterminate-domain 12-like [Rhodamnia argentea]|uniref:Protein indeterminate-domain 12-like n=1 Tax=Rhodamnia argentea TaxID=178133 RepID=A0A8B8Q341_9MYRT|nr:protein indeterminate-domain 12-like [Rhodamnia argentea]